ncbi:MAG: protein kinase [Acidobacteriota bacterium]
MSTSEPPSRSEAERSALSTTQALGEPDPQEPSLTGSGAVPIAPFTGSDRFLVQRRLGAGAFGVVYEAYDRRRRSLVALKVLRAAEAEALYRFKKGFRSLADLRHPNLVEFYELFTEEGAWYFSMELIDGVDLLSALCPEGRAATDAGRVRETLRQLAAGLHAVHDAGMMHRDIKPPNVLVTRDGCVKLLDFGLVGELRRGRRLEAARSPSSSGSSEGRGQRIVGTPVFMAPELAEDGEATTASDWYAVGVMLWQVLTGELPFDGSLVEMLLHKREGVAPGQLRQSVEAGGSTLAVDLELLCQSLLEVDPTLRLQGAEILDLLGAAPPVASADEEIFVGRAEPLARLDRALADSRRRPLMVGIHGPSGIGKSALVRRFVDRLLVVEPDAAVLTGRCFVQEAVPYKALDDLVDALSRQLAELPPQVAAGLEPSQAAALVRLFPVLRRIGAVAAAADRDDDEVAPEPALARRWAVEALRQTLAELAGRGPLVLVVDDVQWGDIDSFALLDGLFQGAPPLLFVATWRSGDDSAPLLTALADARREDGSWHDLEVREIALGRLDATDAQDLLVRLAGRAQAAEAASTDTASAEGVSQQIRTSNTTSPGVTSSEAPSFEAPSVEAKPAETTPIETTPVEATSVESASAEARSAKSSVDEGAFDELVREGGGSPLYLAELARAMQERGDRTNAPPRLSQLLRARVDALEAPARRLLELVAVAGRPLSLAAGARAAALGTREAAAISSLRAARLLRVEAPGGVERLEPYHDRVREAVLDGLDEASLAALHGHLAHALEAVGDADPETLAAHFRATDEDERALGYAVSAAERAERALAFDRAARLYRLALELMPRDARDRYDLRLRLGRALADAGRARAAADTFLRAVGESGMVDPFEAQRQAAEQLLVSGHVQRGLAVLRHVLRTVGLSLAERGWKSLLRLWILRLRLRLRAGRFTERDEAEVDAATLRRIDVCWSAEVGLCLVDLLRASEFHARHLLLALRAGEPQRVARGFALEVFFGALEGADDDQALDRARALAGRVEGNYAASLTEMAAGMRSCSKGHWSEAARQLARAEAALRENRRGIAWELDTVRQFRAVAWLHAGRWRELFAELPQLMAQAREAEDLFLELHLSHWVESLRLVAEDRADEAAERLHTAEGGEIGDGFYYQHFGVLVAATRIALYRGDGAEALRLVEARWPALTASLLQRIEMVLVQSHDLRGRAALAAADATTDERTRRRLLGVVEESARALVRAESTWARSLATALRGGAAAQAGDRDRAFEALEVARTGFEACEMSVHAAAARRMLGLLREDESAIAAADDELGRFGIERPAAMTRVVLPMARPLDPGAVVR